MPDPSSCAPADVRLWTALYTHTVDHQAAVRDAEAQHAVPTAAHADLEALGAREADRLGHVRGARAADDHARTAVDHGIPDLARLVVAGRARLEHVTVDPAGEVSSNRSHAPGEAYGSRLSA